MSCASRRSAVFVLVLLVFSYSQLFAQAASASSQPETPKFSSHTQLVLVPVVVTDAQGHHITGLKRSDFKLEEQGKVREASIFEEVKTVATDAKALPPKAPEGRSNFALSEVQNVRMTIVLIDMVNTPYLAQLEGKRQLIKYLSKSLQREEPMALFGLSEKGLRQLHSFTTDTRVLIAALEKLKGEIGSAEFNEKAAAAVKDQSNVFLADRIAGESSADISAFGNDNILDWNRRSGFDSVDQSSGINGAKRMADVAYQIAAFMNDARAAMDSFQQRNSIRTTLRAMNEIAHAYSALPGRKTLIWASGGFPFTINDPAAFKHMGTDVYEDYERTWQALISANISIYTVDATGLAGGGEGLGDSVFESGSFDVSRRVAGGNMKLNRDQASSMKRVYEPGEEKRATLRAFAESTGGLPCLNSNDLKDCFARAIEDSRDYYMFGYYLPPEDRKPGWRKLKVKVFLPAAEVRAREGFYVTKAEVPENERQRELRDALASPVEFTGIRLNVRELPASTTTPAAGKHHYEFGLGVLGDSFATDAQNGNAVDLTVVTVAFTPEGKNAAQVEQRVATKLPSETLAKVRKAALGIKQPLELPPGKYDIRFAVRDNLSGEIGSVEYPLEVK